jgi:hypothetical protein
MWLNYILLGLCVLVLLGLIGFSIYMGFFEPPDEDDFIPF